MDIAVIELRICTGLNWLKIGFNGDFGVSSVRTLGSIARHEINLMLSIMLLSS